MVDKENTTEIVEKKKEEYLTRFINRSVSIPDLDFNSWVKIFEKVFDYCFNEIRDQLEISKMDELKRELFLKLEYLWKVLPTPRLIKLFGRILKTKIKIFYKDLCIKDVVFLCAIQAANQSLFHTISINKEYFIDLRTSDEYMDIKQSVLLNIMEPDKYKNRVEDFLGQLKKTTRATESEINILTSVFHTLRPDGYQSSDRELLLNRRISHYFYFKIFFNYSEMPHAISIEGLQELKEACKNKNYEDISEIILEQYNSLKEANLTKSYIIFINTFLKRDLSVSQAEKLLFAFGRAAKSFSAIPGFFELGDKRSAAYSIWDF